MYIHPRWLVILLWISPLLTVQAQITGTVTGPQAIGSGGAIASMADDAFASLNGVALIAKTEKPSLAVSAEHRYQAAHLNTMSAALSLPVRRGGIGIGSQRFGDELYHEQRLAFSYGHRSEAIQLGGRINVLQYSIQTLGSRHFFTLDFGATAKLSRQLSMGMLLTNPGQTRFEQQDRERIPTSLRIGMRYAPSEKLSLHADGEKQVEQAVRLHAGFRYRVVSALELMAGMSTAPYHATGGLCLHHRKFSFQYAFYTHPVLPMSHALGILYSWLRK